MLTPRVCSFISEDVTAVVYWCFFAITGITVVRIAAYIFQVGRGGGKQEKWWVPFLATGYIGLATAAGWGINWAVIQVFRWIPILGFFVCFSSWSLMVVAETVFLGIPLYIVAAITGLACRVLRPKDFASGHAISTHWNLGIVINVAVVDLILRIDDMEKSAFITQLTELETRQKDWSQFWKRLIKDSLFQKELDCCVATLSMIKICTELDRDIVFWIKLYVTSWKNTTEKIKREMQI